MRARIEPVETGWKASDLRNEPDQWRIPVPESVLDELHQVVTQGDMTPPSATDPRIVGLPDTRKFALTILELLSHRGPGFVVVTGFPVADEQMAERIYWALGRVMGQPVSQSLKGDVLGRVEDRGADIGSPTQRGYESSAALPFHADRTDVIGLLCVRAASNGGLSQIVASATVHDLLYEECPGLLRELYEPIPQDRRGEEQQGEQPWCDIPVFGTSDQGLVTRYLRRFINGSQRHEEAPRLTARQVAAMDAMDDILTRPAVILDMELRPGDLQLINNLSIMHARTAFEGPAHGAGRLLLRLWLAVANSAPLPVGYAPLYGAVGAGTVRGGVWPDPATCGIGALVAEPA